MARKEQIQHEGIVKHISQKQIEVSIVSQSACSECHAKGCCGMAETKQKVITIPHPQEELKVGDKVMVYASLENAFFSVLLAYIIPSVLILAVIFLFKWLGTDELKAAISALILVVIYFFVLYLLRKKINKKITFTIESISNY